MITYKLKDNIYCSNCGNKGLYETNENDYYCGATLFCTACKSKGYTSGLMSEIRIEFDGDDIDVINKLQGELSE